MTTPKDLVELATPGAVQPSERDAFENAWAAKYGGKPRTWAQEHAAYQIAWVMWQARAVLSPVQPAPTEGQSAQEGAEPVAGYVQPVPDRCDRIVWRNNYYHLPITQPATPVGAEVARLLDKAEADMRGVGAWDHGMHGVPAEGVQNLIVNLRAALTAAPALPEAGEL